MQLLGFCAAVSILIPSILAAPHGSPTIRNTLFPKAANSHTPTQSGIASNCNNWYLVTTGDTCSSIASANSISLSDFNTWNPTAGTSCLGLWKDTYSCIGVGGSPAGSPAGSPPADPSATSFSDLSGTNPPTDSPPNDNSNTAHTPTQSGIAPNCNDWHLVGTGDTCSSIASSHSISLADFNTWNPAAGTDCGALWKDTYCCVGTGSSVSGSPASTNTDTPPSIPQSGSPVATPTPFQAGMVAGCTSFYPVKTGDTCSSITKSSGISLADFYKWNPAVGPDCASLWLDTHCCIAVTGSPPAPGVAPPATTTSDPSPPPEGNEGTTPAGPFQTGIVNPCAKYYRVKTGDTCTTIATANGLTIKQFNEWNPAAGPDCASLWLDTYCCVGISSPVTGRATETTVFINGTPALTVPILPPSAAAQLSSSSFTTVPSLVAKRKFMPTRR